MTTPPEPSSAASNAATAQDSGQRPTALNRIGLLRQQLATELFDNEGLNTLFSHARNVLTATLIIAAGVFATHQPVESAPLPGMLAVHFAGYGVAGFGIILLLLNLCDGLHRLARQKHRLALRLLAIFIYLGFSIRLTQVIVYFRAAL